MEKDVPSFGVLGCHILDRRDIKDFILELRRFDETCTREDRTNLRLFLDRHKGNLFWECKRWPGTCPIGIKCRKTIQGFCICVCSPVTDSLVSVLKSLVQMFWDKANLMESHRQRLSFVTYFDKHGSNILNEV
jgi:hypothetical protein